MANDDTHIVLPKDGRRFGLSEFGAPKGKPLFYFHGFPGSRLEARLVHEQACRQQIRLIAVDRPGYGQSAYQPGRRLAHWPRDIAAIADTLKLDRFSVLGVSGGAPYAAACARFMPERLITTGIVCGLAPLDDGELLKRLKGRDRRFGWLKKLPRPLFRPPLLVAGIAARQRPQGLLRLIACWPVLCVKPSAKAVPVLLPTSVCMENLGALPWKRSAPRCCSGTAKGIRSSPAPWDGSWPKRSLTAGGFFSRTKGIFPCHSCRRKRF